MQIEISQTVSSKSMWCNRLSGIARKLSYLFYFSECIKKSFISLNVHTWYGNCLYNSSIKEIFEISGSENIQLNRETPSQKIVFYEGISMCRTVCKPRVRVG